MLVVQVQLRAAPPIGIILGLTSAAIYSGYILYGSRLLPGIPPVSATATIATAAAIVWSGFAAATGQLAVSWTPSRLALLAGFAVIGILSVPPTVAFIRWRRSGAVPSDPDIRKVRRYLHAELALFVFLPIFAAAMARGYGEF